MFPKTTILLAILSLSAGVSAQLAAKAAEKQLKADIKQTLKTWESTIDQAFDGLYAQQKAFDTKVKAGQYSPDSLYSDLAFYLAEASRKVMVATLSSAQNAEDKAAILLSEVAGFSGDLEGLMPRGFQSGSGGELDGLAAGIRKVLAKEYAVLAKRLTATAAAMEKGSGAQMNLCVRPPCAGHDAAVNETGAEEFPTWPPLSIDMVLAASKQGVSGDGYMVASGSADPAKGKVTVTLKTQPATPTGAAQTVVFEIPSTEIQDFRWFVDATELDEGNWVISATQGTSAPIVTAAIGVP